MRRQPLLLGALVLFGVVAAVVAAAAFSVPANAVTVDGASITRDALNRDLSTIEQNLAFGCYLDASVAVRSGSLAGLPALQGTGGSGTYDTGFVDFWLSQQVNNLLIEQLAANQHLALDATAMAAGQADLSSAIGTTLGQAAAASGQSAVCAPSGAAIVSTLPHPFLSELVRAQAAGDAVLARAAGYGLSSAQLERYFRGHPEQFSTICLSVIQTSTQAEVATVRAAVAAGEPFAAAAKANSTDAPSAANGGALGCFTANEGAYDTVANDVKGLAIGQLSQPVSNNGSYLLLEVTSTQPAVFDAVVPAVRQRVLAAGSATASRELAALTKTAQVWVDPRYGRWSRSAGIGIVPPKAPSSADLLRPGA